MIIKRFNNMIYKFANFFGNKKLSKTITDTVEEAISRVNSNINWFVTNSEMVLDWFNIPLLQIRTVFGLKKKE